MHDYPDIATKCDLKMSNDNTINILVNDYLSSCIRNVVCDNLDMKTKYVDENSKDVIRTHVKGIFNGSWRNCHYTKPVLKSKTGHLNRQQSAMSHKMSNLAILILARSSG